MLAANQFKAHRLSFGISATAELTGSGPGAKHYSYEASLNSLSIFNVVVLQNELYMHIGASSEFELTQATLLIPGLGISTYYSAPFSSSNSIRVEFVDVHLTTTQFALYRLHIGAVEFYVNDVLHSSYGGGSINSNGMAPGYAPLIGIPPKVTGNVQSHILGLNPFVDYEATAASAVVISSHYKIKATEEDEYVGLPVSLIDYAVPDCFEACPYCLTVGGILTKFDGTPVEDTSDMTLRLDNSVTFVNYEAGGFFWSRTDNASSAGWFYMLPNLDKTIKKLGDNYSALIWRGGFPKTTYRSARSCSPAEPPSEGGPYPDPYTETREIINQVHKSFTKSIAEVRNEEPAEGAANIEDPLKQITYLPMSLARTKGQGQWVGILESGLPINPGLWPDINEFTKGESIGIEFPNAVQHRTKYTEPNLDMLDYLEWSGGGDIHSEASNIVTYTNYIAHPQYSYVYHTNDWLLDDVPASWLEYWQKHKVQYLKNYAYDVHTEKRTQLVSASLAEGGLAPFNYQFVSDMHTCFWGFTMPVVNDAIPPDQIELSDSDRWFKEDDEQPITFDFVDDKFIVNGTGTMVFDMAVFDKAPFFTTQLVDKFIFDWNEAQVDTVKITAKGIDAKSWTIAELPGEYEWNLELTNSKYITSHEQDFGLGTVYDSEDSVPAKGASNVITQPSIAVSTQLLSTRSCKYLLFTFKDAVNLEFEVPVCTVSKGKSEVHYETAQFASVINDNASCVRFGQSDFYNSFTNQPRTTPIYKAPGEQNTALDWLCYKRSVFNSELSTDGLFDELESLFTPGIEWNVYKNIQEDTLAFLMKNADGNARGVLINTLASPALALMPSYERDEWLNPTGAYSQAAHCFAQRKRKFIGPSTTDVILTKPDEDDDDSNDEAFVISVDRNSDGWFVGSNEDKLTNAEEDFVFATKLSPLFKYRPWFGIFFTEFIKSAKGRVSYCATNTMRHYVAYIDEVDDVDTIFIDSSDNITPYSFETVQTDIQAVNVCVRSEGSSTNQALHLMYATEDREIYTAESLDEGNTWNMTTLIGTGELPTFVISRSGIRYYYWQDGTDVKGLVKSPANDTLEAEFIAISGVDEDGGVAVDESYSNLGALRITLAFKQDGNIQTMVSPDGKTFG